MKRIFFIIVSMGVFGLMAACSNNQGSNDMGDDSFKKDIVYNEKIQDTFYGVSFGASAQEVINSFVKQDFCPDEGCSTSQFIFGKYQSETFYFGGMSWNRVVVKFNNDCFGLISFLHAFYEESQAIAFFETLLSSITSKYQMSQVFSENAIKYVGLSNDGHWVIVQCDAADERTKVVSLWYGDDRYYGIEFGADQL